MKQLALIPPALPEVEHKRAERALGYMPAPVKFFKLASGLAVLALGAIVFLYPVWPVFKYYFTTPVNAEKNVPLVYTQDVENEKRIGDTAQAAVPLGEPSDVLENKLIIPKIGVDIPLVGGVDQNYGLERGAWVDPETSTPPSGSNTVISAHRFKYRPPHSETFYLLDKVQTGDTFEVYWEGKKYTYRIDDIRVVSPFDIDILEPTDDAVVTLYTCNPLFSTKERLVVRGVIVD